MIPLTADAKALGSHSARYDVLVLSDGLYEDPRRTATPSHICTPPLLRSSLPLRATAFNVVLGGTASFRRHFCGAESRLPTTDAGGASSARAPE